MDFGDLQLFDGVTTYPAIVTMTKPEHGKELTGTLRFLKIEAPLPHDLTIHFAKRASRMPRSRLTGDSWQFEQDDRAALRVKIREGKKTLGEVYGPPLYGIKTGLNDAFIVGRETYHRLVNSDPKSADLLSPFLKGEDLKKWRIESQDLWLINIPRDKIDINAYPAICSHLLPFKDRLERRATKQRWFELQQAQLAYQSKFRQPKIMYGHFAAERLFSYDRDGFFPNDKGYAIPTDDLFLLALLNSSISWFHIAGLSPAVRGGFHEMRVQYLETMPIPEASVDARNKLAGLATRCQAMARDRYEIQSAVRQRIPDLCPAERQAKLSRKLEQWWTLDFAAFRAEIRRQFNVDIPVAERNEWESYLATRREELNQISKLIEGLESQIDQDVYALFNLTAEEVINLEASLKVTP